MDQSELLELIQTARRRIEQSHSEADSVLGGLVFRHIDRFLANPEVPFLEKALYLLLNQFPGDHHEYFVIPRERVRVPEVYRLEPPGHCDFEIDFAVYSGTCSNPVKIAIECDGLRSHSERHGDRDRRKDVNLQSAGWTVIRFGSREIHAELASLGRTDHHINKFVTIIQNVVDARSNLLTPGRCHRAFQTLTGYTSGLVTCARCAQQQWDALEINGQCRHCGAAIAAERPDS